MKSRYFLSLILSSAMFIASPVSAMEDNEFAKEFQNLKINPTLEKDLKRVSPFIEEMKSKEAPLELILGACNTEKNINDRFPKPIILLSKESQDPKGRPALTADFNSLSDLSQIASVYTNSFQKIIVDDSTYKFIEWGPEHLEQIARMLAPGGTFIFVPQLQGGPYDFTPRSNETEIFNILESSINQWGSPLPKIYFTSIISPSSDELKSNEVSQIFEQYKPLYEFLSLEELEFVKKEQEIFPNHLVFSKQAFSEESRLRGNIARVLKGTKLKEKFMQEVVVPYTSKFFDTLFEIEVKYNQPYPVPSNFSKTNEHTVFTCTKKKRD